MRSYKTDKPGHVSEERQKQMADARKAFEQVCETHKLTAVVHYAAPDAPVSTVGFVPSDVDDIEAHKKTLKAIKEEPNKNDLIGKVTTSLQFELDNVKQVAVNKDAAKNKPETATVYPSATQKNPNPQNFNTPPSKTPEENLAQREKDEQGKPSHDLRAVKDGHSKGHGKKK